jgi:hypothetical protein
MPEYTRLLTHIDLRGNSGISETSLQSMRQHTAMLQREDMRLQIKVVLNHLDYNELGGISESELRVAIQLSSGQEPHKKDVEALLVQMNMMTWSLASRQEPETAKRDTRAFLENMLLAKFAKSPSKKDVAGFLSRDSLEQLRQAEIVEKPSSVSSKSTDESNTAAVLAKAKDVPESASTLLVETKSGHASDDERVIEQQQHSSEHMDGNENGNLTTTATIPISPGPHIVPSPTAVAVSLASSSPLSCVATMSENPDLSSDDDDNNRMAGESRRLKQQERDGIDEGQIFDHNNGDGSSTCMLEEHEAGQGRIPVMHPIENVGVVTVATEKDLYGHHMHRIMHSLAVDAEPYMLELELDLVPVIQVDVHDDEKGKEKDGAVAEKPKPVEPVVCVLHTVQLHAQTRCVKWLLHT